jgi:hypothetical protein
MGKEDQAIHEAAQVYLAWLESSEAQALLKDAA